jgi:acetyltransferase
MTGHTKKPFGLDVSAIFEPTSVAVVGASERDDALGRVVLKNLIKNRYKGKIFPVNPAHEKVQGRRCYESLSAIRDPVDLAVIVTPAASVPKIMEECGACNVPAAIIISAGFGESGKAGQKLQDRVVRIARRHGIRFLGPNCMGILRPSINLNASFANAHPPPGGIALASQSGAICAALMDWAAPRGIGFSNVISAGISADVDFGDILDYLVMDPKTDAIMLYIEGVHDARQFMSALRAASRAKPVVVMKAGRHAEGGRAAVSHTGALVGSDRVFGAALERAGVVRVTDYSNFFAVAATLHAGVRPQGSRLAILTNGGGAGVIAADKAAACGVELAAFSDATSTRLKTLLPSAGAVLNPVDVLGDADSERYAAALEACLDDDNTDAVLALLVPQALTDGQPVAAEVARIASNHRKPVFTCWLGEETMAASRQLLTDQGVPSFRTPEGAVVAFASAASYHANQQLLLQVPDPLGPSDRPELEGARLIIEEALAEGRKMLNVTESKALLAAFHIPILKSLPANRPSQAIALAEAVGFPVAMKIDSPDITHKSDVGGVRLGLDNGAEVRQAFQEMMENVGRRCPEARLDGVLLEPMWHPADGRELMVGMARDDIFGPVISVGLGGTMVEVLRDQSIALPPLNRYLAQRMIDDTRASRYLESFRGRPPANRRALEDVILRLSEMICELPQIVELDINPLIVDEQRALAVDARVVIERGSASARPYSHMAIHPYPSDLIRDRDLPDGRRLTIRPIRPEDAVLERDFVNSLSERSRFLRFMYALQELTPEMLSRFTQIDYDREMALIAILQEDGTDRQVGVARYMSYPDKRSCEFAIVVSDQHQHMGIATALLSELIDIARDRRFVRMDGLVLRENVNMLKLAERLGFDSERDPDDPDLVRLELDL